ncbi:hypothetical protein [Paracoccus yeei]|uniref:hypothetical protein n=1 Tax=Paracoccus yeei TaxID=147645 RepID=UPI00117F46DC|nr:hypothetical protein [Paracoccus yeei]
MDPRVLRLLNVLLASPLSEVAYEAMSEINSTNSLDLGEESDPQYDTEYEEREPIRQLNIVSRYVTNRLQLEAALIIRSMDIVKSINEGLDEEHRILEIRVINDPDSLEETDEVVNLISESRLQSIQDFLSSWTEIENATREIIENEGTPDSTPDYEL